MQEMLNNKEVLILVCVEVSVGGKIAPRLRFSVRVLILVCVEVSVGELKIINKKFNLPES